MPEDRRQYVGSFVRWTSHARIEALRVPVSRSLPRAPRLLDKDETRTRFIKPMPKRPPVFFRWRTLAWASIIVWSAVGAGCSKHTASPVAPSDEVRRPLHELVSAPPHNLLVTVEADVLQLTAGDIAYVCRTQPREYVSPDGLTHTMEIDSYVSARPCPSVPID